MGCWPGEFEEFENFGLDVRVQDWLLQRWLEQALLELRLTDAVSAMVLQVRTQVLVQTQWLARIRQLQAGCCRA